MMYVPAKNQGPARPGVPVWLIVIHTMEAPEKPHTAQNVAFWFAGTKAPQASVHYCVDSDDTVQCVKENVVAWGAPGANKNGIHIEHAGYASQSSSDWQDVYSQKMLLRSAALAAGIAKRYGIPVVKLTAEELGKNPSATGFCGHVDVTNGRNAGHGHTDPGASFPWYQYLEMVLAALAISTGTRIFPTLELGSTGPDVQIWQRIIGVIPDGFFGPQTDTATKRWQSSYGLTPDGVVGPKTWATYGEDEITLNDTEAPTGEGGEQR